MEDSPMRLPTRIILVVIIFGACCTVGWLGFDRQTVMYAFIAGSIVYWWLVALSRL